MKNMEHAHESPPFFMLRRAAYPRPPRPSSSSSTRDITSEPRAALDVDPNAARRSTWTLAGQRGRRALHVAHARAAASTRIGGPAESLALGCHVAVRSAAA
ncbi:hypothetical protein WME79_04570 [Sorangium sp. So ce726]|uniref:hypothetical protein n=1 Tax=Sorangium sp. So ce726 TaxID=3133319 RepID=UPI003F61CA68